MRFGPYRRVIAELVATTFLLMAIVGSGIIAERLCKGLWMHYRLAVPPDSRAARILQEVRASLANDPELQRDRERLKRVCCAPEKFVRLQSAPAPAFAGPVEEKL